jgi:GH18 family chitinase
LGKTFLLLSAGWGEGSEKYSVLVETEESRAKFVESVLKFIVFYGFDGVSWSEMILRSSECSTMKMK